MKKFTKVILAGGIALSTLLGTTVTQFASQNNIAEAATKPWYAYSGMTGQNGNFTGSVFPFQLCGYFGSGCHTADDQYFHNIVSSFVHVSRYRFLIIFPPAERLRFYLFLTISHLYFTTCSFILKMILSNHINR